VSHSNLVDEYMVPLLAGNRASCRALVFSQLTAQRDAKSLYEDLIWPAMERVERLYRSDRINSAAEHMATRINRAIATQLQPHLPTGEGLGKVVLITCAEGEPEELGAQMTADLFESRGWGVYFLGGGVPNDEILTLIGQLRPDLLLVFGTQPQGVPGTRRLIDMIRDIGVHPAMNIMVSGGVFNRAEGLWKEVNADLFAKTAAQAIPLAESAQPQKAAAPRPGAPKRRRRRRRSAEPVGAEA
jgi:methanogenic corrinoid protein MtbC1